MSNSGGAAGLESTAGEPEIPPAVVKRIARAVESSRSEGTLRTYTAGWRRFADRCEWEGYVALLAHPVAVAAYLVDAADTRTETGERGLRRRHLRYLDRSDQPPAPHHRPPVPVRT